jgi:2-polyprenyl-3-methyl-5-hydroxy-6-metoxy-1,4-benzoquinol methylase
MSKYGELEYWDDRFENDKDNFEFYGDFERYQEVLLLYCKKQKKEPDAKILHYGCGTSKLSEDLHKGGAHTNIHSIDFSLEAIGILREQTAEIPELTWETMDALDIVSMFSQCWISPSSSIHCCVPCLLFSGG